MADINVIVITDPMMLPDEGARINELFSEGLQYLHLRKPGVPAADLEILLESIDRKYYNRIILHDHYHLLEQLGLGGVHLNMRNLDNLNGRRAWSCSCHSLDELPLYNQEVESYMMLSPIFDSVSKNGYSSRFDSGTLADARRKGLIDSRVVALGGILPSNLEQVVKAGFGGAAVLGYIWRMGTSPVGQYLKLLNMI